MAKKRKTRTQKMSADRRHSMTQPRMTSSPNISDQPQETLQSQRTYTFSQSAIPASQPHPVHAITVAQYGYLARDLRKTALVTALVIIAELILSMTVLR